MFGLAGEGGVLYLYYFYWGEVWICTRWEEVGIYQEFQDCRIHGDLLAEGGIRRIRYKIKA